MAINAGMMSSDSTEWETPDELFDSLSASHGPFDLDVCASDYNAKDCDFYFTKEDDGLTQKWFGTCWMNPPFGNAEWPCKKNCKKKRCAKRGHHTTEYIPGIRDWVRKAYQSAKAGCKVICLLPARTDTGWWHRYIENAAKEIHFLKGRVYFVRNDGKTGAAPFPCVVVILGPGVP